MNEQPAGLKATYRPLYDHLVTILFKADIAGISHFAEDEYEQEVRTILPRLHQATCEADVERIIREEFASWFWDGITRYRSERFTWAAKQIWAAWLESEGCT